MSTDRQNITHVFIRFRTRRSLSTDTGVLKFKSRHHLDVTAFERQPAPKASLYGLDQPAVLIAEERGLHEDETKGQEEPLAPCPTLDLNGRVCQVETEWSFIPHAGPGASEKANDTKEGSERIGWWLLRDHMHRTK